ncbi:MAG TPA: growth inhibitor PemK [Desulfovibrio sp.]|nr:growth inhibitor PemK [Desulfovibrio sp.]
MVTFTVGTVVTVPFPFTDQSNAKIRPAIVLSVPGSNDCILCAVTSSSRWGSDSVSIKPENFKDGQLRKQESFALPAKLLTADNKILRRIGKLREEKTKELLAATRSLF